MKRILKIFFVIILALLARLILWKYQPKIVMVTGSVGKTSTKDAIAAVLQERFFMRASEKSFNTEFGIPFTVFGVKNPWTSPIAWLRVFKEAASLVVLPNHYPKLLVLEVGADRPGDLARSLQIATPDVVVVTRLPDIPVHVEAYASPEAVREEEFMPAYALAPGAPLIINIDDPHALAMSQRVPARVVTYGCGDGAMIRVSDVGFFEEQGSVSGMQAHIRFTKGEVNLVLRGSVGCQQVLPAAAAFAVAEVFNIPSEDALKAIASYQTPPGRNRILKGINGSILIDDSYNSSPAACEEALKTLQDFPHAKRRIAILGDMLELGRYSVMEHERIGTFAAGIADIIISIGVRARAIKNAAEITGMPPHCLFSFDDAHLAIPEISNMIRPGDVVLIKGSQSRIRLERIVEALLADHSDVTKLVRQEKEWKVRE